MKPPFYGEIFRFFYLSVDHLLIIEFYKIIFKRTPDVILRYSFTAHVAEIYSFYKKHKYRSYIKDWNRFQKLKIFL